MTHSTEQFETELLKKKVLIDEIKKSGEHVREVIGFVGRIRYTWNAAGDCFQCKKRIPKHDIKFNT